MTDNHPTSDATPLRPTEPAPGSPGPAGNPDTLLPCPFCGVTPKRAWHFGYQGWRWERQLWAVQHNCKAGHGYSEAEAIAAWNTRKARGQHD
jgi:hypothetical protein